MKQLFSGSIKCGEFLDYLSNYFVVRKKIRDSAEIA
jgi:hypothetical protein